jgi:UDP-2-acetamido-2-deoxy-ribo-hexuluronate aminotransferase
MIDKIQMVDLQSQYKRLRHEIEPRVQSIMELGQFIHGPSVGLFERELQEFLKVKHVIGVGNGTDALQLAFMALDLQAGDEVIIPSFAYAALPEVLLLLNLKPVYVDADASSYCLDVSQIEQKITEKTKAIAPVHLFGGVAEMEVVNQIAKQNGLFVVEDTAQAIGAQYCGSTTFGFAGCIGDIGTTSFFPSKNLGCYGDGGAVFTNNDVLAEKIRKLANHGQSKKYYHELVGVNSRLDTIQAEILRVKLPKLIEFNNLRNKVAQNYLNELADVEELILPTVSLHSTHVFHQFTLRVIGKNQTREQFRNYLTSMGIPSMVYYPLPLHKQTAYFEEVSMTISEKLCEEVISLPICPELTPNNQDYIISTIKEYFKKN